MLRGVKANTYSTDLVFEFNDVVDQEDFLRSVDLASKAESKLRKVIIESGFGNPIQGEENHQTEMESLNLCGS